MDSKRLFQVVAVLSLAGACRGSSAPAQTPCEAPELVDMVDPRYNLEVCAGVVALNEGRWTDAVSHLLDALEIPLFEYPNVLVLPRLALAQWRAGEAEAARSTLQYAQVAMSVLAGVYSCDEGEDAWRLVDVYGRAAEVPGSEEVTRKMCGLAFEWVYERTTIESLVDDAEVMKIFLEARAEIEGN